MSGNISDCKPPHLNNDLKYQTLKFNYADMEIRYKSEIKELKQKIHILNESNTNIYNKLCEVLKELSERDKNGNKNTGTVLGKTI